MELDWVGQLKGASSNLSSSLEISADVTDPAVPCRGRCGPDRPNVYLRRGSRLLVRIAGDRWSLAGVRCSPDDHLAVPIGRNSKPRRAGSVPD